MLENITPVLLTYNELSNIHRTLSRLAWAKDIVIVDSGSTDGTLDELAKFPTVRVFNRSFDNHASQWCFATGATHIKTDWILRLDADYQVTEDFVAEVASLTPSENVGGYSVRFAYAIFARRLLSSLYPPKTILLRRGSFSIWEKGHTEAWTVEGEVVKLKARIVHDDRKTTVSWLPAQQRYMERELQWMRGRRQSIVDRLRLRPPLMPILVFLYCLFVKGLIVNGRAGVYYALQRLVTEAILSLMILEDRLGSDAARSELLKGTSDKPRSSAANKSTRIQ